jgi:hypothetical protein
MSLEQLNVGINVEVPSDIRMEFEGIVQTLEQVEVEVLATSCRKATVFAEFFEFIEREASVKLNWVLSVKVCLNRFHVKFPLF